MELPSRFQIGERVRVGVLSGEVAAVTFDNTGKVSYDVLTKSGLRQRLLSELVCPATLSNIGQPSAPRIAEE